MSLRVGILARSAAQSYALQVVVKQQGLSVGYTGDLVFRGLDVGAKPDVDAWILAPDHTWLPPIESHPYIDTTRQQVLMLDEPVPTLIQPNFAEWKKQVAERLRGMVLRHQHLNRETPAKRVWVLAASTGGLEAVSRFLSLVTPDVGVGLVYVQHLQPEHEEQLLHMISRRSRWPSELTLNGGIIRENCVTVVSPRAKLHVETGGRLRALGFEWTGQYRPSIDHVAGDISRQFRDDSGMIVFTGMGYDGVMGSRLIRHRGGEVWVQDPATCTATAMPEAVIAAQAVDYLADVEGLASEFMRKMKGGESRFAAKG